MFRHTHPPTPKDPELYNQEAPTPTTIEELKELRKLPKYTLLQNIIALVYFLVFGIVRIVLVLLLGLVGGASFVFLCALWRTFGKNETMRSFLKRYYAVLGRILLFILGMIKIQYHGRLNPDARFAVSNHICFLDGWVFLPFGPRPLAKSELFKTPIVKDMLDVFDGIPVDRSHSTGVTKKLIENALDSDRPPIMLAPEGATTSGDYMFRFRLGAFLSDLPVQPVAIKYTLWFSSRSIHHMSFFHNYPSQIIHFLGIPFITVDVTFMEPISLKSEGENDPRKLADVALLRIANFLGVRAIDQTNSVLMKKESPATQK